MTPWTRQHKEDSKACTYGNALLIKKADDMGMEDMNLSAVYVICNQCSILPNMENEIPF
jgi:hypothetical protein